MHLSQQEANQLECSIFHYFLWRQQEAVKHTTTTTTYNNAGTDGSKDDDDDETATSVDTTTTHSLQPIDSTTHAQHDNNNFKRIVQVMKEDFPHVTRSENWMFSDNTPEVNYLWMKYAALRNVYVNNNNITLCNASHMNSKGPTTTTNKKRKRDNISNKIDQSITILKSAVVVDTDAISTPEDAQKEVLMSELRKQQLEAKHFTELLNEKLLKSDELLKFQQEKLRFELKLAQIESEGGGTTTKTTTEQKIDNDQEQVVMKNKEEEEVVEEDEDNIIHLRKTNQIEKKEKQQIEIQESMFTNTIILVDVHHGNKERLSWESRIQQLVKFKQQFGHCDVPINYKGHIGLYEWLRRQFRYYRWKNPNLKVEQITMLKAIGVTLDVDYSGEPRSFEGRVEQCRVYSDTHGHLRIPLVTERNVDGTEISEDDYGFRLWAQSMRIQKQKQVEGMKNTLDKYRIGILDNFGFQWSLLDGAAASASSSVEICDNISSIENLSSRDEFQFHNRIEELRKVKDVCGDCNVKKNIVHVFPNNYSLHIWVKNQRQQMKFWLTGKKSTLTEERINMLRSIEFDHEPRNYYYSKPTSTKTKLTKNGVI